MGQEKRRGTLEQRVDWAKKAIQFVDIQFHNRPRELAKRLSECGDARRLAERMINDTKDQTEGS